MLLTQLPRSFAPRFLSRKDGREVAVDREVGRLSIGRGLDDYLADNPSHDVDPHLSALSPVKDKRA